jgi:hypothetical protein
MTASSGAKVIAPRPRTPALRSDTGTVTIAALARTVNVERPALPCTTTRPGDHSIADTTTPRRTHEAIGAASQAGTAS